MVYKKEMLTVAVSDLFCQKKGLSLILFFIRAQKNLEFLIFLYISMLYIKSVLSVTKYLGLIWVTILEKKALCFLDSVFSSWLLDILSI